MNYASVCDGIGAVHVAWQPLGWTCEWTAEIDAFPSAVVEQRWGFPNRGDMTKFNEWSDDGSSIDLLVGGTPCQSFSVAGLRKGLHDPRGGLMLTFLEIAQRHQPRWLVWENVPGVLSSSGGRDFGSFLGALGELGYGWAYRVLDAQWFGVAQRRRRVFVVGCLGDERRAAQVLFESESVRRDNPPSRAKGQGVAVATPISTRTGRSDDRGDGGDNIVAQPYRVANCLTQRMHKGINTTCDEGQTPVLAMSFDWQKGNDVKNPRPSTMNVKKEQSQTLSSSRVPAVAFTNSHRAQSTTDDESWVPGEVSPTMSCFDQGDTRATTVVAFSPLQGGRSMPVTPECPTLEAGTGNKAPAIDFTQNSRDEGGTVVAFNTWGGEPRSDRPNGGFYVEENAETSKTLDSQGGLNPSASQGGTVVAFTTEQTPKFKDDCALAMTKQSPSGGGQPLAVRTAQTSANGHGIAEGVCHTIDQAQGQAVAFSHSAASPVAFNSYQRTEQDVTWPLGASDGRKVEVGVRSAMSVRRLTPRECERLQGFPDDYTAITYRKKPAADGPRYKALGNSMAVPVMRWIGERIDAIDKGANP